LNKLTNLRDAPFLTRKWWVGRIFVGTQTEELRQAKMRVAMGGTVVLVLLVVILWQIFRHDKPTDVVMQSFWFVFSFVVLGVALVLKIRGNQGIAPRLRFLGMLADNAGTTYFMWLMGEQGAFVFGIYLFVAFGNALRFPGRLYLHASQVLAILGFGALFLLGASDYWPNHPAMGWGILAALIVLPHYVGNLAGMLEKQKDRAEEANQTKDRFLANVSHEMRTPLNGVIAMADLLRETSLQETQRELVQTLSTSAQLALAQIEDVLDMAKLQAGRVAVEARPFDLGAVLTSVVKVVVPQARYKRLEVNTQIAPDATRWFFGDAHHLKQVVLNLLSNAIKFTEAGQITLRAWCLSTVNQVSMVRVEVEDTGIGIDPTKKESIFEPFTQADDSITRIYGGTGLGTTIAKQLVVLMGGRIGAESAPGLGSTFWFEVPLQHSEPQGIDLVQELAENVRLSSSAVQAGAGAAATVHRMRGARVLVAEDNPTNQRVTELILESAGHVATIVSNGEAALDALEQGGFHLALFDLSMPGVSGLEALKLYRFTTTKPIPILILSANVTAEAIAQCQAAGAAEFISKPVRPSVLLEAIERHLSGDALATFMAPPPRTDERPSLAIVDTPVVDPLILADLAKLSSDPTFVRRLVLGFQADSARLVEQIATALAQRRYEGVKDAAHALKGGAGGVGATQLLQFAIRLEKANHETLRLKAAQWTDELQRIAARTNAALEEHVSKPHAQRPQTLQ
jgi:two-component system sensor histidine kinase RpfC